MDRLVILAIVAGISAHNGIFIRGEWHLRILHIIVGHVSLGVLSFFLAYDRSVLDAFKTTSIMAAVYLTALFGSMTAYRLFFHQLCKFPGPRLAAVSKLWHVWQVRNSTNFLFLKGLYDKYGPVIRTGPNEVTLVDPDAHLLLDGPEATSTKDIWYDILQPRTSVIFARDGDMHKKGRKVWEQSMSNKAMSSFNPRVADLAAELSRCIRAHGTAPVNVNEVMSWYSFDVMGDVMFGRDFSQLKNRTWSPEIQQRDNALALVGPLLDAIWLAHVAFLLAPFYKPLQDWAGMISFCEEKMKERIKRGPSADKLDMAEFFISEHASNAKIMSLNERNLYLGGTTVTAMVAGSDTTRAALIVACWYLAKYPEHAEKILLEVENADLSGASTLAGLPHLNGFINETLRIVPPALTGNARITGPDGLVLGDIVIPPHTKVTVPKYITARLPSAFPRPEEFIPERWYKDPELILQKRGFTPFGVGKHQCVGKSLAYVELRYAVAQMVRDYHILFAPGYNPETMYLNLKDQVTAQPGEVLCVFEPRE